MKTFIKFCLVILLLTSCNSAQSVVDTSQEAEIPEDDIVRIANDKIEYEIIIIEPGFNSWLNSTARPEGYYSQSYMETRNRIYVQEWNNRVMQVNRFDSGLYEFQIDYNPNIDYGYDVNYKLYNYFIYFQLKHNQKLGPIQPRI
ncbi:DUF6146 family protein [Psychroserpens sp.]|uniref:DUF6146 family protein n=1 Tax=Psychroserpens sp. TaxID=2020870 RepID=UPI002B27214B|nr:DUF6146 family protein [Psychroserpens sp.]